MNQAKPVIPPFTARINFAIVGYIVILFSAACSMWAFRINQFGAIWMFAWAIPLGILILLLDGKYTFDTEKITHENKFFGAFQMFWRDVQSIDISTMGSILLNGENQRFVIIAPSYWSGPDKQEAFKFLSDKIQASGITPRRSRTGDYKGHKNCRVADSE